MKVHFGEFRGCREICLIAGLILASPVARAADANTNPPVAATNNPSLVPGRLPGGGFGPLNNAATIADHKRMLELLHIESIRRGRDGNNKLSTNFANYDEAKANPYPQLPDPLVLKDGRKVATAAMWWDLRRPEIVEDFDREIYGRVPKDTPKVAWELSSTTTETNGTVPVITRKLVGHVDNSIDTNIAINIQLTVSTPENASGPLPLMMQFGFGGFGRGFAGGLGRTNGSGRPGAGFPGNMNAWQQLVLGQGWGYAILTPNSIQADNGAGLTSGIIGLMNQGRPRKPDDWGALRAWA